MDGLLIIFVFIVFIIVITEVLNEKIFKISSNIALLIVSFGISIVFLVWNKVGILNEDFFMFSNLNKIHLDKLLLEGALCFMIFAGASKFHFSKFISNYKQITLLSILTTVISSVLYAIILYGISVVLNLNQNISTCFLLGCIISPTDPIAATGILNKLGMPKGISSVIEGESLFNDGIGVALFVFIENLITNSSRQEFLFLVGKNIVGAVFVGLIISFILFKLTKKTKNPNLHILISLLNVSSSYVICEHFGFSGVISAVICGFYFSYQNKKCERWKKVVDSKDLYTDFWNILDELLNKTLFVLIGLTAFIIPIHTNILYIIPIAIIVNFVSRYVSIYFTSILIGKDSIPNKYSIKSFTKLMTFCAMRGGVSLAMAFSTVGIINNEDYNTILNITLITILFTTIIQGMLIPVVYKDIELNRKKKTLIEI